MNPLVTRYMDGALARPGALRVLAPDRSLPQLIARLRHWLRADGDSPRPDVSREVALAMQRAADFSHLTARRVMIPRSQVVAVRADATLTELVSFVHGHPHSRYPVFDRSLDNIVGVISAKQVISALVDTSYGADPFDLRAHLSLPLFVPEQVSLSALLAEMKQQRSHLAILVDEYGATAGLLTFRDLIERLAGAVAEVPDDIEPQHEEIQWLPDGSARVSGLTLLSDLEAKLPLAWQDTDFNTLGGYMFGKLDRVPQVGDEVVVSGHRLTVEAVDGLRIAWIHVVPETGAPLELSLTSRTLPPSA
jgi:CBS domain containing-hemolysin-like protein